MILISYNRELYGYDTKEQAIEAVLNAIKNNRCLDDIKIYEAEELMLDLIKLTNEVEE